MNWSVRDTENLFYLMIYDDSFNTWRAENMRLSRPVRITFKRTVVFLLVCCMLFDIPFSAAFAAGVPGMIEGGNVTHGSAAFSTSGNTTTITTGGPRTIIEYSKFNINAGQIVDFVQPSINAATLNRIMQANPSLINGTLLSNGQIFLINPAGIMFGNGAKINVNSLVASGLNMSDADFLQGNMLFSGGNGSVFNQGSITAEDVYLVG